MCICKAVYVELADMALFKNFFWILAARSKVVLWARAEASARVYANAGI